MTRDEATIEACAIIALAYRSIGDYSRPSDGFCSKCIAANESSWHFENAGHILQYVREAVLQKLHADGYEIHAGFGKDTGREIEETS